MSTHKPINIPKDASTKVPKESRPSREGVTLAFLEHAAAAAVGVLFRILTDPNFSEAGKIQAAKSLLDRASRSATSADWLRGHRRNNLS